MKAMILAAGRGTRMGALTRHTPKPLLEVAGRSLIEHQLARLATAGFEEIVINTAYLGHTIEAALGNGAAYGVRIAYSHEGEPLETGGGVWRALPLLGSEPFALLNGDVWIDGALDRLRAVEVTPGGGHLLLVPNPSHNPAGDFYLDTASGAVTDVPGGGEHLTFSGVSVLHPRLIADYVAEQEAPPVNFSLVAPLRRAMALGRVGGEHCADYWLDVGTPERLTLLRQRLTGLV